MIIYKRDTFSTFYLIITFAVPSVEPFPACMMHRACIECIINERHSTRDRGTRVSAACASISLRACARYDARGLERVRETNRREQGGWRTDQYGDITEVRGRKDGRKREGGKGRDSVTSRWKKRRQYRVSKYSPRRSEEKKRGRFRGERETSIVSRETHET